MNKADLIAFEDEMTALFEAGQIKSPLHLAGGNEQQLIDIFKDIKPDDWVCGAWRMHYHCLLKGVPPHELKQAILAGRSIALCFPKHRVISSALVGGIMPIALGLAKAIQMRGGPEQVFCFIGDMTARSGIAHECTEYAAGHDLPIVFVVEDNGLSVCTNTNAAWGHKNFVTHQSYDYTLTKPHVGLGKHVRF